MKSGEKVDEKGVDGFHDVRFNWHIVIMPDALLYAVVDVFQL
jgi:hypothetical protein